MEEELIRIARKPSNGNGDKKPRGRPKGIPNPNAGRKPGKATPKVYVKKEVVEECKSVASMKALMLTENILDEESRLAFSDIRTLFDDQWNLLAPFDLPREVAAAISSIKIVRRTIPRGRDEEPETETTYHYTFWDKGRALERLSRHLGLYEQDNKQKGEHRPAINLYLEQGNVQVLSQLPAPANGYHEEPS